MKHNIDLSRSELIALIDEWIFNERDRLILYRRLLDNVTYEKLGEEFGLSDRHIKRIVYKAEQKLISKIKYH